MGFGDATDMATLAALLQPGYRIGVRIMGKNGVVRDVVVKPRSFDPRKPDSLLGCQITDICPAQFAPHPALRAQRKQAAKKREQLPQAQPEPEPEEDVEPVPPVRDGAREAHALLHRLPRWHDEERMEESMEEDEEGDYEDGAAKAANPESEDDAQSGEWSGEGSERSDDGRYPSHAAERGRHVARRSSRAVQPKPKSGRPTAEGGPNTSRLGGILTNWRIRCALLTASLLNLAHGCAFLAAPSFGSEAAAVVAAYRKDLWRLATSACTEARRHRALEVSTSGALSFDDFVHVAFVVSCLQLALTAAGVLLSLMPVDDVCSRKSAGRRLHSLQRCAQRLRGALVIFYLPAALLLWLLLAAACMYCLAFRWEANDLLSRYWQCLAPSETAGEADDEPPPFASVTFVAALCASADLSAILGLFAFCGLIGWRTVLRASVMAFGALSALCGMLLAAMGLAELPTETQPDAALPPTVSVVLVVLGGAFMLLGSLGLFAAKGERTCLLQVHAALLALLSLGLAALCLLLLLRGAESLHPWLEQLHIAVGGKAHRADEQVDEMVGLLQTHRLSLSAASVLGLFLLVMNGTMALGLRWVVRAGLDGSGEYERVLGGATAPLRAAADLEGGDEMYSDDGDYMSDELDEDDR